MTFDNPATNCDELRQPALTWDELQQHSDNLCRPATSLRGTEPNFSATRRLKKPAHLGFYFVNLKRTRFEFGRCQYCVSDTMQSYVSMAELLLASLVLATRPICYSYFALYLTLLLLLEGMYPPYVSLLMDVLENFSLDSPNTSGGLYRLRYRLQRKERKN